MTKLSLSLALALALTASAHPCQAQQTFLPSKPTPAPQTGGEVAAQTAANVWLALLDDGQFEKSYEAAAGITHNLVAREQWIKFLTDHRPPLGKVLARTSKSSKFAPTLQGAPPGQYVVVECTTRFEHKEAATETITTALDQDGQWKVAGYFVK